MINIKLDEIKRFRETLKIIADDINTMANIPSKIRKEYLTNIQETMLVLNEELNMLILYCGDLLAIAETARNYPKEYRKQEWSRFKSELSKIDVREDWLKKERIVRVCPNLRVSLRKTKGMLGRLKGKIALGSMSAVNDFWDKILKQEDRLADYISLKLKTLGEAGRKAVTQRELKDLVKIVEDTRESFKNERTQLMRFEIEISNMISP